MKIPQPFAFSVLFFLSVAVAAIHWRAGVASAPEGRDLRAVPTPDVPINILSIQPAALGVEDILRMSPEELWATAAALIKIEDPAEIHRLILVYSRLAEVDPEGGMRSLLKLIARDSSWDGFFAISGFLSTWLSDDHNDPTTLLMSIADPQEKKLLTDAMGFASMMWGLAPSTAAKVTSALSTSATDVPGLILAAQAESAQSPDSALTKLLSLPESRERQETINLIVRNLLEKDPVQALRLAGTVPFEGEIPSIIGRSLQKLVKDNPSAALDYIVSHPGPVQATNFLNTWDSLLAAAGPEAVLAAAAKVEDPDIRRQIIGHAAVGLSDADPFAAAKLMGGMEADDLVMPLWEEVAARFGEFPESRQQEWLRSLPSGPGRDAAVSAVAAQRMRSGAPDSAMMLLREMEDATARVEDMISLAAEWRKKDQPAADSWLTKDNVEVPAAVREAILGSQ